MYGDDATYRKACKWLLQDSKPSILNPQMPSKIQHKYQEGWEGEKAHDMILNHEMHMGFLGVFVE